MHDNQELATDIIDEEIKSKHNLVYQKPKTSLFLDPKVIAGGASSIPESNSGVLS